MRLTLSRPWASHGSQDGFFKDRVTGRAILTHRVTTGRSARRGYVKIRAKSQPREIWVTRSSRASRFARPWDAARPHRDRHELPKDRIWVVPRCPQFVRYRGLCRRSPISLAFDPEQKSIGDLNLGPHQLPREKLSNLRADRPPRRRITASVGTRARR